MREVVRVVRYEVRRVGERKRSWKEVLSEGILLLLFLGQALYLTFLTSSLIEDRELIKEARIRVRIAERAVWTLSRELENTILDRTKSYHFDKESDEKGESERR